MAVDTTRGEAVDTTRGESAAAGAVPCRPTGHPATRPVPPGPRPVRPAERPAPGRPGGRRAAPELPAVRPRVHGGTRRAGVAGVAPLRVVHRRRRVAVVALGLALAVLVAVAVSLLDGAPVGAVPSSTTVTVVGAGESLTDVARRSAPGADAGATVERIRELNTLSSSSLTAGRPLVVPAG
jgi:hypothetical protein